MNTGQPATESQLDDFFNTQPATYYRTETGKLKRSHATYIYLIFDPESQMFKIGRTNKPSRRLYQIKSWISVVTQ